MIPYHKSFSLRHLGNSEDEIKSILKELSLESIEQLIQETIPEQIIDNNDLGIGEELSEMDLLQLLECKAAKNKQFKSYIGQGYYGTFTPPVIQRNVFENPGWYTQYTPYQAEIAQGRLEALLNFQTMVCDLTGMEIANASLLDEGTAAAEAMTMLYHEKNKRVKGDSANVLLVDEHCFPQTIDVLKSRAIPLDIDIQVLGPRQFEFSENVFACLLQYPNGLGNVIDYSKVIDQCKAANCFSIVAADLLALCLIKEPAQLGVDAVVGNTQRFGVPMGYGGPHAAYFATHNKFKRQIPGRIIGVSIDADGKPALRMALQTREQHIRREKATSNICTAQALLAVMSGMYAVYLGPEGLKGIAREIHSKAQWLESQLVKAGYRQVNESYFDTLHILIDDVQALKEMALSHKINLNYVRSGVCLSLDETITEFDLRNLLNLFRSFKGLELLNDVQIELPSTLKLSDSVSRKTTYLQHEVFHKYRSETSLMRYIKLLENKDLSLTHSMIPLGSCTMKLNAAVQLFPVSWKAFGSIHPFVPKDQVEGYLDIIAELEEMLCKITGFTACSLQPNSGAQGELSGLLVIRKYHEDRNEAHRNIALIPASAHGTNPASAVMAGMKVVVVATDKHGNISEEDLKAKATEHKDNLAALMVTYPSTHGVFEEKIQWICEIIHQSGGLVYMDGANMNAQVGYTSPGKIGADVCHLNLHKTFAIPHGGGGPGMGPICCNDKLKNYLPNHPIIEVSTEKGINAVSAAPYGSASILLISYAYIKLLGSAGLKASTEQAILNANYMKHRLDKHYDILYVGKSHGRVAHELIVDFRKYKQTADVTVEDVAKRLIDYGFHAPTVSFPVNGTMMIEPTESENKEEIDRFCDALISIKEEIDEVEKGIYPNDDNVLVNAPHTIANISGDEWNHSYSREKAAYPLPYLKENKFWSSVSRVNNPYGDRNLVCTCPPVEAYVD